MPGIWSALYNTYVECRCGVPYRLYRRTRNRWPRCVSL